MSHVTAEEGGRGSRGVPVAQAMHEETRVPWTGAHDLRGGRGGGVGSATRRWNGEGGRGGEGRAPGCAS